MESNYKKSTNFKRNSYVSKISFFSLIICLFFSPIIVTAHDGKEPKEKVEKVTEKMLEKKEQTQGDSLAQEENKQTIKDFDEISKAVEKGTVPTVIKALSLAVFIAGFAFLYLPKKKKEVSNEQ